MNTTSPGPALPGKVLAEDGTPLSVDEVEDARRSVPGALGRSPLQMPPSAWWAILKRVYVMVGFHNLTLLAAGVAYFAFLAFVPFIASIVLIFGLVGDPATVAQGLQRMGEVVPPEVLTILEQQLLAIVEGDKTGQGFGLALSILVSLYGAQRSAGSLISALNVIYEEHETRNILRTTGLSISITLGMMGIAIVGLIAISLFSAASTVLRDVIGEGAATLIQIAIWIVSATLASGMFAMIFRFAPDRRAAKWRWLSVGSVIATLLWLAVTLGFGVYASHFTSYNATYGSLSAVVVFLIWLFLSAFAVLLGAEVNSEMERQTIMDSTVGPDRPIGLRGAIMADSVVVDRASRALLDKKRRREAAALAKRAN